MKGEDMQRKKVYTKIPRPGTLEVYDTEWAKSVEAWVEGARRRGVALPSSCNRTATELLRVAAITAPPSPVPEEYREHCARVPEPTDQQVLAPEGTDPGTSWFQLKKQYFIRGQYFLCRDAGCQRTSIR